LALAGGSEAQNLSGESERLRWREMMKSSSVRSSSSSESERERLPPELEEEESRTEQEEKSRSKKGPSSSSPRLSEAGDAVAMEAARRAASSRRICI
jgi:hypothetical protein